MKKKVTNTEKDPKPHWLLGGNSAAIERQEAKGQKEFVESLQLPSKCNSRTGPNALEYYHKLGIKTFAGSKGDDLFIGAKLPEGWKKESTDHDMWSNLLDDKGRVRATIFYKAAFYDRDSFINFNKRISYSVERLGFLNGDYTRVDNEYNSDKTPYAGRVKDFDGKTLFETEHIVCDKEYVVGSPYKSYTKEYIENSSKVERELRDKCLEFLEKNYPNYLQFDAYWNE